MPESPEETAGGQAGEHEEPDVAELDQEPDYNPDEAGEEGLKDLKGG